MDQLLILFDIDGTIIHHVGTQFKPKDRFQTAIEEVYGVRLNFDNEEINKYMGVTDREFAWKLLEGKGITRDIFLAKFPHWIEANHEYLTQQATEQTVYIPISDAKQLIMNLVEQKMHVLGLLTGNSEKIANWKLSHTGFTGYFTFGLYGDEADNRIELAKRVFIKARDTIGRDFVGEQIVVIGDTTRDIDCGEAIGAFTIGVTTGYHAAGMGHGHSLNFDRSVDAQLTVERELLARGADLVVDSLMDAQVKKLFGLD